MFILHRARKSEDSEGSEKETIIPAGHTYLTKVNGKLVMAREKKPKATDVAIDLLGEAFGTRTIVHRRARSVEPKPVPLLLTGAPANSAQNPECPQTTPIPQLPFQPFNPYLQQGGLQPFMQHQPLPMNPFVMKAPQVLQQPQHYTVQPTGVTRIQSAPSKEEIEDLKRIDAHFNKVMHKKTKRLSVGAADESVQEEDITKTTVTITKHICANCGRLRSRKYHAENPLQTGDRPAPAFCGKCQKDSSETSDSDSPKPRSSRIKEKFKKKKIYQDSGEDEQPDHQSLIEPQKPKFKKQKPEVLSPAPEFILVEEEGDHILSGKLPRSKKIRSPSPTLGFIVVEEEHSEDEKQLKENRVKSKKKKQPVPAQEYTVVEDEYSEDERVLPGRRHGLQIEGSKISQQPQEEYFERRRHNNSTDSFQIDPPIRNRQDSFGSVVSQLSQQSRRRRVERANAEEVMAPWDAPHIIRPRSGEETVVITERYLYKPKKQIEAQSRKEKRDLKTRLNGESEEAARYYNEDWAGEDHTLSPNFRENHRQRIPIRGRYRRDSFENSELAVSESTDYHRAYDAVFHDILPRALSPPPSPSTGTWPEASTFYHEDGSRRFETSGRGRSERREYSQERSRRRSDPSEAASSYGPSIVKQIGDPCPETALTISPRRSCSRDLSYIDDDLPTLTEQEQMAERETKRVTFREPSPSSVSVEVWSQRSDVSESFLKRKTSWDNSAVGPTLLAPGW